ncbi:hypothetical protein CP556_12125 [Natrinema sp. CBA1119]|uniref:hypothetical protein n=1 Tax=Natrinema sp. CBA1119 TaxID=1608465 RepID=UPI000BF94203|nr:hypothetical protein [Natrinema sp. CBA1119]PGF16790.1 hypothetical protein CP556_12125 [Natrinema sp. CBA1119]
MTRFDATEPAERRKLYVDAIVAHRDRESTFLTFEADDAVLEADADGTDETETTPGSEDGVDDAPPAELSVPWIQFGDGTVNLDCTDAELETLKTVIGEFSAFKIDELIRPEEAEGVNARISAKADPNRIAQFVDEVFLEVYDLPAGFRVWVAEV